MVQHYNYIFRYYNKPCMISASITDQIEDRARFKPSAACAIITNTLRERTGDPNFPAAIPRNLMHVGKKYTVKRSATFEMMDEVKASYEALSPEEKKAYWG